MIPTLKVSELKDLTIFWVESKGRVIVGTSVGKREIGPKYIVQAVSEKLTRDIQQFEDIIP